MSEPTLAKTNCHGKEGVFPEDGKIRKWICASCECSPSPQADLLLCVVGTASEGGKHQPVGECFFPQLLSMFWPCSAGFGSLPVAYLFLCISQLKHLTIPLKSCPHQPSYTHPLIPAADGNERGKGQNRGSEEVEIRDTDETKGLITCALCSGAAAWVLWCTCLYNGFQVYKKRMCSPSQCWGRALAIP